SLGVDNKAAILATSVFSSGPGHYLMDIFHNNLRDTLEHHGLNSLRIRWTPGHIEIPGNKLVDEEAKEAAEGSSSRTCMLPKSLKAGGGRP
ncbi:hypothetical protein BS17DRAFT_698261, partial [Gyrodon lividus]